MEYLFTSERLGFRSWEESDIEDFTALNKDKEVMRYFPNALSNQESLAFYNRLKNHHRQYGYTYFPVEIKEEKKFIGFIGMAFQEYSSQYTPATDIGWRLFPKYWGRGYATEGARACLHYGFEKLKMDRIISVCPRTNIISEHVMVKLKMEKLGYFEHPKLANFPELQTCVCYEIKKVTYIEAYFD